MSRQTQSTAVAGLPRVFPLERRINTNRVHDLEASIRREFLKLYPKGNELRGKRIGLTAVSRQVANYQTIFRAVIAELRARGAEVFVIPAVGSHGGATAYGKLEVLSNYGITEESIAAPILPRIDTTRIAIDESGVEVWCANSVLADVDGVFLFGRVRRHWDICWPSGLADSLGCYPLESGLNKLALGLSVLKAAKLHAHKEKLGWAIQVAMKHLLLSPRVNVVGALAVVDNEEEDTAIVEGVPFSLSMGEAGVQRFCELELDILKRSQAFLPQLPFINQPSDLLYLHYFGKPYAGQGADPKIIGRNGGERNWCEDTPRFSRICASRLIGSRDDKEKPGTFNAMGLGNLDYITRRFERRINWEETRLNAATAACEGAAKRPQILANDAEMLQRALSGKRHPRAMFAVSSVWMRLLYLSESYFESAGELDGYQVRGTPKPIPFTADGFVDFPDFDEV